MQIILTFKDNCIILNILFLELTFLEHLLLLLSDTFQQYLRWFIGHADEKLDCVMPDML